MRDKSMALGAHLSSEEPAGIGTLIVLTPGHVIYVPLSQDTLSFGPTT
jgi:hypothetical protein